MANDAIARVKLVFNGAVIEDFKSITEKEVDFGKQVPYMNKTGHAEITPRFAFDLEYIVPKTGKFNFMQLLRNDAVVEIYYDGGDQAVYRGVRLLKRGERKADGETEQTIVYEFMASERDPEE